ncbi:MAG: hypothetical protein GXO97_00670 [Nitrospirae bacterium]|nr:hypothetical protein [Nitrospirota bacterium]
MKMIKRINRISLVLLLIAALVASFFDWKKFPAGILVGGALALANLKGIQWGIQGITDPEIASQLKGRIIFFSLFRLLILFIILAILLYLRLVNIWAIMIGLTIVFVTIMIEGLREAKFL